MATLPTITLHGTHPRSLVDDYCAAMTALTKASSILSQHTNPNARDYPGDSLVAAQAEHQARLDRLAAIRAELEEIATFASDHPRA
jgi:hypothetical protein